MRYLWLLCLIPAMAHAAEPPKGYNCYRTAATIVMDGKLDDAAWANAPWTDDFVDIEGDKKPLPRFRTRVKMLWDDEYFYIAAEMEEPHVWATIHKRDSVIFRDNDFEVFLDPDGDNHEYGELEVNALNTQWDLFLPKPYKDDGHAQDGWNIEGLQTAVMVNGPLNDPSDVDSGWSVEIALPWKGLEQASHTPQPPAENTQWRVNFSRVEWKVDTAGGRYSKVPNTPEDNWVWSPQGVINMHRPEMWGIVRFLDAPSPSDVLPTDPYWTERMILHDVYYAEYDYHKAYGKYTSSLSELVEKSFLKSLPRPAPVVTITPENFHATLDIRRPEGEHLVATIRHDSRFTVSPWTH